MQSSQVVLAPYYSCVMHNLTDNSAKVYILGQASPISEYKTTLRYVSSDGINSNLGIGSQPNIDSFFELVETKE